MPIRSEHPLDGAEDITGTEVELAFVPVGQAPEEDDRHEAVWEVETKTIDGAAYYLARILVGPGGGAVSFTPTTTYDVYARVDDGTQRPTLRCGRLTIY
ncbi:MAG: hypothetical protein GEV08_10205 [Acidimicrobiia bacterium]|nr:hypothetical protein [Acidimicrobiia bacterium]